LPFRLVYLRCGWNDQKPGGMIMAWTTPKFEEVTCGFEINLYFAAEL